MWQVRVGRNQNLREPLRPLRFKASKKDQPRGTQGFAEKNLFEKQEAAGLLHRVFLPLGVANAPVSLDAGSTPVFKVN